MWYCRGNWNFWVSLQQAIRWMFSGHYFVVQADCVLTYAFLLGTQWVFWVWRQLTLVCLQTPIFDLILNWLARFLHGCNCVLGALDSFDGKMGWRNELRRLHICVNDASIVTCNFCFVIIDFVCWYDQPEIVTLIRIRVGSGHIC